MEAGFISMLLSWCPTAVSGVLVFLVSYLIRKSNTDSRENAERAIKLRDEINKTLNSFGERLSYIKQNYVKNDFFFRELSGWRSEINRLGDKTDGNFAVLIQNIMQFLNQGKK